VGGIIIPLPFLLLPLLIPNLLGRGSLREVVLVYALDRKAHDVCVTRNLGIPWGISARLEQQLIHVAVGVGRIARPSRSDSCRQLPDWRRTDSTGQPE
jgi:hypothetical protein